MLFENKSYTEEETVLKAIQDARSWKAAQDTLPSKTVPQRVDPPSNPSPESSVRIFRDAAWNHHSGNCGLGW